MAHSAQIIDLSLERLMRTRSSYRGNPVISMDAVFLLGAAAYSALAWALIAWLIAQIL